ncbi:hypothetical protein PFNF54_02242 [Plasmodium falciparum NF54]|uniref:rRNA-processing protein FCF1 n=1 Tax=Plasmodium falciparum (isolate NF54) TaxID=5843 RepID=W7KHA3_PLAFO|nr:hypothetical protein PFNF54_02242 [Plasmodium falciparum NF54]
MGKFKKTQKIVKLKRVINPNDKRIIQNNKIKQAEEEKKKKKKRDIQYKIDIIKGCSEVLLAKCNIFVTDCVIGEMEKLGQRYSLGLKLIKDPRFKRLTCNHKGTYADDCIVNRVTESRCYIIATNDRDLKIRLRKIPGVPILYAKNFKYKIERLPDNILIS